MITDCCHVYCLVIKIIKSCLNTFYQYLDQDNLCITETNRKEDGIHGETDGRIMQQNIITCVMLIAMPVVVSLIVILLANFLEFNSFCSLRKITIFFFYS